MAQRPATTRTPTIPIGETGTRIVQPDAVFQTVQNLVPTDEGGLRSVVSGVPFITLADGTAPTNGSPLVAAPLTYGDTKGIFHATVMSGEREILLLHTGTHIWTFYGWQRGWAKLVGPEGVGAEIDAELPDFDEHEWPTQFVATPTGVVIIPQYSRAYFYDGTVILPLGYDHAPGPPVGRGPESSSSEWFPNDQPFTGVNDVGYAIDGLPFHPPSSMHPAFRYGRVGTVETPGNVSQLAGATDQDNKAQVMGVLRPGRYRAKAQWVDRWGNLSPWSGESSDVKFQRQPSMSPVAGAGPPAWTMEWVQAEAVLKQIAWAGVQPGPDGTIGRIIARSKDLVNSGTADFFELPVDATVNTSAFATLPDNATTFYPDNIPDAWLNNVIRPVAPVPQFRLAEIAFNRLWVANWPGAEGAVRPSWVGRWGTMEADRDIWPDPSATEVTGLKRVNRGMLLFTEKSTHLMESNDMGDNVRLLPLSSQVGCVAPSSIVTMRNGVTIWLGHDGFYAYDGSEISFLWDSHRRDSKRFNRARMKCAVAAFDHWSGEYRCWVATGSSQTNDTCYTYDGTAWHTRTDVQASGVTVTADHRKLMIACGVSPSHSDVDGVWVLDRNGTALTSTVETGWIRSMRSDERASMRRVYLLVRETGVASSDGNKIQVYTRRDYRSELTGPFTADTTPDVHVDYVASAMARWGTGTYDDGGKWRRRRPFVVKVDVNVPACEAFQLKFTCSRDIEYLGIAWEEQHLEASGARAWS